MDRRALWKALRSRSIPDVLTDLIVALHENTGAAIRVGKNKSARLATTSGVRQGCILAPELFWVAVDWILNHMTVRPSINRRSSSLSDLVYADDKILSLSRTTPMPLTVCQVLATDPQCSASTPRGQKPNCSL